MPRTMLLLFAVTVAAVAALSSPPAAQAASTVCQTVNNRTVCSQSGDALSCQTVNGETRCLSGSGTLRCETVNGHTACTTTPEEQARSRKPDRGKRNSGDPEAEEWDSLPIPTMPEIGAWDRGLSIERDGRGLRVRTGTLDLRLDRFP